jgi:hypothetical protein
MTQASKPDGVGPNSSAAETETTESKETVREQLAKEISDNPRFMVMKPSGKGFVIGGARPAK